MKLEEIGFYTLEEERAKNVSEKSPMWRCELLVTSKCNFNCPYCRGTDKSADITLDYAKLVVDLWADDGLKNIRFSGGEPTCVEWLPELIEYAAQKSSIERIAISTNGSRSYAYYKNLWRLGVNDFSISLDACCSADIDRMSGTTGNWDNIKENILKLSKLTYVTVGCVFDENNVDGSLDTIRFAHNLGVSDIRIISSAQYNEALQRLDELEPEILKVHPILKYRVFNYSYGRNVRGIHSCDTTKCHLVKDDSAIKGDYHYPCIIYLREGGEPIGRVGKDMRKERLSWVERNNTHKNPICRENCLDVCVDYNNTADFYFERSSQ